MDNKKWGKRFSTIFWWLFAFLPLFITLIYFVGYHLTFNSGINTANALSEYHSIQNGNFLEYLNVVLLDNSVISFKDITPSFIYQVWQNLFDTLGVTNYNYLGMLFGWATWVFMVHCIFDIVIWLFRFIHSVINKYEV